MRDGSRMETPDPDLGRALRQLAVVLGNALDDGANQAALVHQLTSASTDPQHVDLVEDALLAAGQLLAGADPLLPLLTAAWGADDLLLTVDRLTQELRGSM